MKDEKGRKLSAKEQKRLEAFEATCERLANEGYTKSDLVISIGKANLFALLLAIPLVVVGVLLFRWANPDMSLAPNLPKELWLTLLYFLGFLLLIVVHELIHGLTWSLFAEHHFKDIDFGLMVESFTPYCTCATPLRKTQYILGALMPCLVLGIIPSVIGILMGWPALLWVGIIMTLSASGDLMITAKVLGHKPKKESKEVLVFDHPTQAGSVIFEK